MAGDRGGGGVGGREGECQNRTVVAMSVYLHSYIHTLHASVWNSFIDGADTVNLILANLIYGFWNIQVI